MSPHSQGKGLPLGPPPVPAAAVSVASSRSPRNACRDGPDPGGGVGANTAKGAATAEARRLGVSNLWQKGFYDHILRSGKAIDEAAWYIFLNPVRAGLAKTIEEWPYSGSFSLNGKAWRPRGAHFIRRGKKGRNEFAGEEARSGEINSPLQTKNKAGNMAR